LSCWKEYLHGAARQESLEPPIELVSYAPNVRDRSRAKHALHDNMRQVPLELDRSIATVLVQNRGPQRR